jgi:peptide-methionine (R)-S-oxide reductase
MRRRTDWPGLAAPPVKENGPPDVDRSLFMELTEVLCARCDANLGHLYDDSPAPAGLRNCLNSAHL